MLIRHGGLFMRSPAVKLPRKERPVAVDGAGHVLRTILRQPRAVRRECRPEVETPARVQGHGDTACVRRTSRLLLGHGP